MKKNAFTLIEMLAVLTILGIILVIAIPSISGFTNKANKRRIKSDANLFELLVKNKISKDTSIEINGEGYFYLNSIDKDELNGTYDEKSYVIVSGCEYKENPEGQDDVYNCNNYGVFLYDVKNEKTLGYSYERDINKSEEIKNLSTIKNKICKEEESWCDIKSIMKNDFSTIVSSITLPPALASGKFYYYLLKNNTKELKLEFGYNDNSFIKYDNTGTIIAYQLYSNKDDRISGAKKYYVYKNVESFSYTDEYSDNVCNGGTDTVGGCIKSE